MNGISEHPRSSWLHGPLGTAVISLAGLAAVILFTSVEVLEDGTSMRAISGGLLESIMIVVPAVVVLLLYRQITEQRQEQRSLLRELERARADGASWRSEKRDLLRGLGEAIDEQFGDWELTAAEKEVALLMLKGLNHKEIAGFRGTSERTVRQQARAVYAKSNLSGRTALFAYFLEDLLLPVDQRT